MGHHHGSDLSLLHHLLGDLQHLFRRCRIQSGGVFIQKEEPGRIHCGHKEGQGLTLSAGKQPHILAHPVLQSHIQLGQLFPESLPVHFAHMGKPAAASRRHSKVLLNGHVGGAAPHGVLKKAANVSGPLVGGHKGHVPTIQFNGSGVCIEIPGNGIKKGRFSRPIGADNGHEITRVQMERQIGKDLLLIYSPRVEGHRDMRNVQHARFSFLHESLRRMMGHCSFR